MSLGSKNAVIAIATGATTTQQQVVYKSEQVYLVPYLVLRQFLVVNQVENIKQESRSQVKEG